MSISYVLKQRKNTYGDYRDDIQSLIEQNPNQMSFDEYTYIYELIKLKEGCNLLIFGLGRDSELWLNVNKNGKTIFLEDNPNWINTVNNQMNNLNKEIDIRHITYSNLGYDADRLLTEYKSGENNLKLDLPEDVSNIDWDIIIVDAPAGYGEDVPCRMKSIYESYNLSNEKSSIDVIVHDAERRIEKLYTDYFFESYDHVKTLDDKKHGVLKHYKSKGSNE